MQTNAVGATATAAVSFDATQQLAQDDVGAAPDAGLEAGTEQRVANAQTAEAVAEADQTDPQNLNTVWGVPVASVQQSNVITAEATATATVQVLQLVDQQQETDDSVEQWVDAGQAATNAQTAEAVAEAGQTSPQNLNLVAAPSPNAAAVAGVEQTNAGAARAAAALDATIGQEIDQNQLVGGSTAQEADAAQVHANAQDGLAAATVGQTRTTNLNDVTVPAGSRATNPSVRQQNLASASASATDTSEIDAWIVQGQGGSGLVELTIASQQGSVRQSAATYSPASQSDLLNRAAWAGIEPVDERAAGHARADRCDGRDGRARRAAAAPCPCRSPRPRSSRAAHRGRPAARPSRGDRDRREGDASPVAVASVRGRDELRVQAREHGPVAGAVRAARRPPRETRRRRRSSRRRSRPSRRARRSSRRWPGATRRATVAATSRTTANAPARGRGPDGPRSAVRVTRRTSARPDRRPRRVASAPSASTPASTSLRPQRSSGRGCPHRSLGGRWPFSSRSSDLGSDAPRRLNTVGALGTSTDTQVI